MGRRRERHIMAGVVLLAAAAVGGGEAAAEEPLSLAITGAAGARYTGHCTLTTAAGEQTFELTGTVPHHEEFTGEGLACRIEAAGRIVVEVARGGSVSRSVTSGGTVSIAVR